MRALICLWFIIIVSYASVAETTSYCARFFGHDEVITWVQAYINRMTKLIYGQDRTWGTLDFYWHFPIAENPNLGFRGRDLKMHDSFIFQSTEVLENNQPFNMMMAPATRANFTSRSLVSAFLKNYRGETSEREHDFVKELEDLMEVLANDRQGFGYVASASPEKGGKILGTFRVFNGTPNFSTSVPLMPMEYFARLKGLKFIKLNLEKMREENPKRQMFELGKHSIIIPPPFDLAISKSVKEILDLFFLRNYVENVPPDSLFFLNTWNPDMVKVGESRYGLKVVEVIQNIEDGTSEYYMMATAKEVAKYMREKNNMPEINQPIALLRMLGLPNIDGQKLIKNGNLKD